MTLITKILTGDRTQTPYNCVGMARARKQVSVWRWVSSQESKLFQSLRCASCRWVNMLYARWKFLGANECMPPSVFRSILWMLITPEKDWHWCGLVIVVQVITEIQVSSCRVDKVFVGGCLSTTHCWRHHWVMVIMAVWRTWTRHQGDVSPQGKTRLKVRRLSVYTQSP